MKVSIEKLPKFEVKLTIELSDDEMGNYRQEAAKILSQRVEVPGFRKGHAPAFAVESQVGKEAFSQEVLRVALPRSFAAAVQQEKLQLICRPRITLLLEAPFTYEAVSALLPKIDLKDYTKVKIEPVDTSISDEEMESVIREMQKVHATYKPKETEVAMGDRVEISFQGYDTGGAALENTKSNQHPLFVGEKSLVEGFEEQLVGMKVGEKKKFPITFPKGYHHAPFRGKTVNFEVEMQRIEEVILPLLDEALVEKIFGEKVALDEFHRRVKEDLVYGKRREARQKQESSLIEQWISKASFDLPPSLLEEEIDYLIEEVAREVESRGMKWETFVEHLKQQKKELRAEKRTEAEKRVRVRLVVNEIMQKEGIQVSEEEVTQALETSLRNYPAAEQEKLRASYADRNRRLQLMNSLRLKKLFDKFLQGKNG